MGRSLLKGWGRILGTGNHPTDVKQGFNLSLKSAAVVFYLMRAAGLQEPQDNNTHHVYDEIPLTLITKEGRWQQKRKENYSGVVHGEQNNVLCGDGKLK